MRPQGHVREANALSPPCAPVRTAVSAWPARSLAHSACVRGAPKGVPEDPHVTVLNPSDVRASTRLQTRRRDNASFQIFFFFFCGCAPLRRCGEVTGSLPPAVSLTLCNPLLALSKQEHNGAVTDSLDAKCIGFGRATPKRCLKNS